MYFIMQPTDCIETFTFRSPPDTQCLGCYGYREGTGAATGWLVHGHVVASQGERKWFHTDTDLAEGLRKDEPVF